MEPNRAFRRKKDLPKQEDKGVLVHLRCHACDSGKTVILPPIAAERLNQWASYCNNCGCTQTHEICRP